MIGYLGLVLTAHVPFVRHAYREPHGEDALHETIAQSIIPVLNTLYDFHQENKKPALAMAYSPILLDQLADTVVQKHFQVWMDRWLEQLNDQLEYWQGQGEEHGAYLARFYLDWGQGILRSFESRYNRHILQALRDLCNVGILEPLASSATHAYLPLLQTRESLSAQVHIGLMANTRQLGMRPRGFWLPECGYTNEIDQALMASGIRYTIFDPSSVSGQITHLRPRWVHPRRLSAFIRDQLAMEYIFSPDLGYMGDPIYRNMSRDWFSGLAIWRGDEDRTDATLYDPFHAFVRAREHAEHWYEFLDAQLQLFHERHDRPGMVIVPLDAELLGRRWFEGPSWLQAVLDLMLEQDKIGLIAPSTYLRQFRPRQGMLPKQGSWGLDGLHVNWQHPRLVPLQQAMLETEERLAALVVEHAQAKGIQERILNQALRELLLAQSSDWLLLGSQGSDEDPLVRPSMHLRRCHELCDLVAQEPLEDGHILLLEQYEEEDNPFPAINFRMFVRM